MNVTGMQHVKINLDVPSMKEVTIHVIRRLCDLPEHHYIKKGRLIYAEHRILGGHSDIERHDKGEATDIQVHADAMIEHIDKGIMS